MSYINETDFVIENKKLVYPEIVTDGLQLYYDAKGKRDTDYHRDTLLDMSGNRNHGKLHNFAYEKHSGYKDGLVFDYIDDKLVRPTLNLKPDDFTFMLNGNIISFSPDGTVKRVQDGEVIESKGFNMLYDMEGASSYSLDVKYNYNKAQAIWVDSGNNNTFLYSTTKYNYKDKHKYYISYNAKPDGNVRLRIYANQRYLDGDILNPVINEYNFRSGIVEAESQYSNSFNVRLMFGSDSVIGTKVDIKDLMMIDLTETFGAGKEPTKEQMDEIINRFGFIPNAQDLIDRVEYKGNDLGDMENIIDGLYKTEVLSGEEVYTDKADDSVVHVEVDGKSVGGGSGKNLVHTNTFTGTVISSSTTTNAVDKVIEYNIPISPDRTYTLSGIKPSKLGLTIFATTSKVKETITGHNAMYSHVVGEGIGIQITNYKVPVGYNYVTITTGGSFAKSHYSVGASLTWSNIQIEEGSTATAYEPPAPTPNYPVEIHSLNDFDVVSSVGRENIFQLSKFEDIPSNLSSIVSLIKDGFRLTNTYGCGIGFAKPNLKPGKTYTISGEVVIKSGTGNNIEGRFVCLTKDATKASSILLYAGGEGKFTSTFSTPTDFNYDNYHGFHAYGITTKEDGIPGVVDFINIKIEEGQHQTPYSLSSGEIYENSENQFIDKINLLLSEPLRSVGDVKDRLFRDNDGLWKIERNIYSETLNAETGLTTANKDYDTDLTSNRWVTPKYRLSGLSTHSITTHFKRETSVWFSDRVGHVVNSGNQYHLNFPNKLLGILESDSASVRTDKISNWLQTQYDEGTPVVIEGVFVEPNTEILSDELQDKLNNLRSFEDSNYVYTVLPNENNTVSDNLKPTLHAKFLYNNWYKEDRVINNLMIYNRALTNEEMLQNYKTIKRRWGM